MCLFYSGKQTRISGYNLMRNNTLPRSYSLIRNININIRGKILKFCYSVISHQLPSDSVCTVDSQETSNHFWQVIKRTQPVGCRLNVYSWESSQCFLILWSSIFAFLFFLLCISTSKRVLRRCQEMALFVLSSKW